MVESEELYTRKAGEEIVGQVLTFQPKWECCISLYEFLQAFLFLKRRTRT